MVRKEKSEVLKQLPAKVIRTIPIQFDTERARKYALETEQLLPGGDLDLNKLKFNEHISAARVKLGELKVTAALEHISNILAEKKKVVVFAWHKSVIKELAESLRDFVLVTGDSTQEQRKNAVENFQTNDKVRIFLGNIAAAGVGLTLTAADHVVMVEHDWTPANNHQAEDRIHRIGQESTCVIDYLIAKNSLEHRVFNLLSRKEAIIEEVMRA
jgi:SWI/SNF-related matrix-associated actin-dependent regulator 1 of chromatin subfamily A